MRALRFVVLLMLAAVPLLAQEQPECTAPYFVDQAFPANGPEETRWRLCWQVLRGPNLVILGAWFRPAPSAEWIKVVGDARLSQLFVPYHRGQPRYLDVNTSFPFVRLNRTDCAAPAVILGNSGEACKEVRDRGLMWKHDGISRRGEQLVMWGVMSAANYNYIVEWTFRDDGVFLGRVGATGQLSGLDAHMHGPLWRLDLDINGAGGDSVMLMKHSEDAAATAQSARDLMMHMPEEFGRPWHAETFTMLHIHDATLKNANGKTTEWALMASRDGTPLHQEPFTKNAFWVTRQKWFETRAQNLPDYVADREPIENADIVVWYFGGLHHIVRDEDLEMTHLMWTGFMLKPMNLFARTPLFP